MTHELPLRTVGQAIEDAASSTKTGYRFIEENSDAEPFFTYAGVERQTARLGGALQALGLRKGDRVAFVLPDNADFVFAFLGAVRAGLVPVPIYPPAGLGKLSGYLENTLHIVAQSGARVLVTSADIKRMLGTLSVQAPDLTQIVAIDQIHRMREELRPEKVSLDDTCFLQFTSGSTSRPKGVVLTHRNLAANVRAFMERGIKVREGVDSGVSWLPLYHDMGLIGFVLGPVFHRNTVTFLPPLLFLKRPARWLDALSRHRGTVSFAPNFAYALCVKRVKEVELKGLDLSSWRLAGCGAEPIRADNLRAFADKFSAVGFSESAFTCCYGMAESTLAVSFSTLGHGVKVDAVLGDKLWGEGKAEVAPSEEAPGAVSVVDCGPAFEGHDAQIFAPDDEASTTPLPERTVGEIRLRGPSVTSGYFNEPELTREAFAGGWLKTGDLGYLAGGSIFICGRSKEVIIVNGRNYYPQDLEWEATKVDGVRKGNVVAFGTMKPHNDRERVVIVFETSQKGEQYAALKAEVRQQVQQSLGLTVDDVVPVDAGVLPKTSSGKLQRTKTRELYEQGTLLLRTSAREVDRLELVKELAKSQVGFLRSALLGGKRSDD
jgi:fatty-acyl-CoA synthase